MLRDDLGRVKMPNQKLVCCGVLDYLIDLLLFSILHVHLDGRQLDVRAGLGSMVGLLVLLHLLHMCPCNPCTTIHEWRRFERRHTMTTFQITCVSMRGKLRLTEPTRQELA